MINTQREMINKEKEAKQRFNAILNKIDNSEYLYDIDEEVNYLDDMGAGSQFYFRKNLNKLFKELNYKDMEETYFEIMSKNKDWAQIKLYLDNDVNLQDEKIFDNFKKQTYDYFKHVQRMINEILKDDLIKFKNYCAKDMARSLPIITGYLKNNWV